MKTQKLSKKNYCKYPNRLKGEDQLYAKSRTFLEWSLLSLVLTIICSACDYFTLFQVIDKMLHQGEKLNSIVTATVAIVENTLPLLMVYLIQKHRFQRNRYGLAPVVFALFALILLFSAVIYMRWESAPFTFDMIGVADEDIDKREAANRATTLLLALMPIMTSVANGLVFYISPTVYDHRWLALKRRIIQLQQQIIDLDATVSVLADQDTWKQNVEEADAAAYNAAIAEMDASLTSMQEYVYLKLAAHVGNPDAVAWMNHRRKAPDN